MKAPKGDDPMYYTWDVENLMIISWLVPWNWEQTHMFLSIAKELWDIVSETYLELCNFFLVYEIKTKIHENRQGNQNVTKCYNILKRLWQELDLFYEFEWACATNSPRFKKAIEKDHVFEFLAELNTDSDEVRGWILGKEPLPSTREVFSRVRREESQRIVMMGKSHGNASTENSALNAEATEIAADVTNQKTQWKLEEKGKVWCDFWNKPLAHRRDFLEIARKTTKFKRRQIWRQNWVRNAGVTKTQILRLKAISFSKEQLEHFYKLLDQAKPSPNPIPSFSPHTKR